MASSDLSGLLGAGPQVGTQKKGRRRRRDGGVRLNVSDCHYEVVRQCATELCRWKLVSKREVDDPNQPFTSNVYWVDCAQISAVMQRMLPYQKINHFPGMYQLARKSMLAKNLQKMRKLFPEDYDFSPRSWVLPGDMTSFRKEFNPATGLSRIPFIIKPDGGKFSWLRGCVPMFLQACPQRWPPTPTPLRWLGFLVQDRFRFVFLSLHCFASVLTHTRCGYLLSSRCGAHVPHVP